MEFIKLQSLLQDTEVDHITEAGWLAILARDVAKVLVDLGKPPIPGIPGIRTCLATSWWWWTSSWSACEKPTPLATIPRIRSYSFLIVASIIWLALVFCFVFILFIDVIIFHRLSVSYVFALLGLSLPS
jgi:hypothetical protein